MQNEGKSALLVVALPFLGLVGGVIALSGNRATVLGFPAVLAWVFLWIPLASLLMHIAWTRFDRPDFTLLHEALDDVVPEPLHPVEASAAPTTTSPTDQEGTR